MGEEVQTRIRKTTNRPTQTVMAFLTYKTNTQTIPISVVARLRAILGT